MFTIVFLHLLPPIEPEASTEMCKLAFLNASISFVKNTCSLPKPKDETILLSILPTFWRLKIVSLLSPLTCNFLPNKVPIRIPSATSVPYWSNNESSSVELLYLLCVSGKFSCSIKLRVIFLTTTHSMPLKEPPVP